MVFHFQNIKFHHVLCLIPPSFICNPHSQPTFTNVLSEGLSSIFYPCLFIDIVSRFIIESGWDEAWYSELHIWAQPSVPASTVSVLRCRGVLQSRKHCRKSYLKLISLVRYLNLKHINMIFWFNLRHPTRNVFYLWDVGISNSKFEMFICSWIGL